MADQGRWFKLWTSAPADDDLQSLPPALRWAWAAFGAYTKLHGTRGTVTVNPHNTALAAQLGVAPDALFDTLKQLPHMTVEEGKRVNGSAVVTWHNWRKYQEDSTVGKRVADLRSKRRREEKRGSLGSSIDTQNSARAPTALKRAVLADDAFMQGLRESPTYRRLDLDSEMGKLDWWLQTPRGRGKKKTRGRIVAWLNRALEELPLGVLGGSDPYKDFPRA